MLLLDVLLPDGRGPDLAAEHPELPVVFMSGYPDEAAELLGTPGRHYLLKPFEPLALLSKLRLALGLR